jgi:uncharacterized protein (DUF934 family)
MRRIISRREVRADDLRYPGEPDSVGSIAVLSAADWIAASPTGHAKQPGAILLSAADAVEALAPHLAGLSCIVVEFARIGEGRGFSQGRLLRQRYGYTGELRARGALKRDQLFFLARCGFDAFELDPAEDLEQARAALDEFTVAYQGGDDRLVEVRRRLS